MKIKTFRAKTMSDALAQVRAEFGSGAAVLHTREVNSGPIARLFRGPAVEVAATPDHSPLAERAAATGAVASRQPLVPSRKPSLPASQAGDPAVGAYGRLVEADFDPDLARDLVRSAKQAVSDHGPVDPVQLESAVRWELQRRVAVNGRLPAQRGGRHVSALVGPTGVGKTTTLAKLAANYRLHEGVRVGLITVDTYRVAAVEQLRTYAEIIDLPMEVVATPDEMRAACEKFADLDLVLIDTAGRSPRDAAALEELAEVVAVAEPDQVHLVVSLTANARGIADAIERFSVVRPTTLALTKLDETPSLGHAAAPIFAAGLPVGYLTDGQNVPEDIREVQSGALASLLLGREANLSA